jgi:hypothetical protein
MVRKLWHQSLAPLVLNQWRSLVILALLLALLTVGLVISNGELLSGLLLIVTNPSQLISDYVELAGPGPALVNAALVALVGFFLLVLLKVDITGPTVAALFLMLGFGLFGKNILNIWPIIAGVWLYARAEGVGMRKYILPALFGTSLGPVVSMTTFGVGFGIPSGALIGLAAGFVLPPIASHLLRNHQGHNLYNLGFAAGFIGIFMAAFLRGFDKQIVAAFLWNTHHTPFFTWLMLVFCLVLTLIGLACNRWRLTGYRELMAHPGTLVTDFITLAGFGPAMLNMGVVGLIGLAYLVAVGGAVNGPTMGGLFTMIGFAAFGKHPRNILPVMFGVWLGTFIFHWSPSAPGALLAALFGTTLAPLSMQFGWPIGIAAGMIHLMVVHNVGVVQGGLNLYNNGFSGGLVATAIVAVHRGLRRDEK